MVELSPGEDVIISESVYRDPEVADFLSGEAGSGNLGGFLSESFTATFKGFEQEAFQLWRMKRVP
jgi:hypothetical protein